MNNAEVKKVLGKDLYGSISCLIFVLILLLWFAISQPGIELYIIRLPDRAESQLMIAILILPSLAGTLLGGMGILRPKHNKVLAAIGFLLNLLQTIHFTCGLGIAG